MGGITEGAAGEPEKAPKEALAPPPLVWRQPPFPYRRVCRREAGSTRPNLAFFTAGGEGMTSKLV